VWTLPFLKRSLPALAALLLLAGAAGGPAEASRSRKLDRLLEETNISDAVMAQLNRSYSAVLKAGGDSRDTLALVEICLEGGFEGPQIIRVLSLLAQLELSGLPPESYSSKIHEGVAKRVPVAKILAAAERQALMLKNAENILNTLVLQGYDLGVDDQEELLPTVAEALYSGKTLREVREILVSSLEEGDDLRRVRRKLLR
jgi:hypothetical protein